MRACTLAALLVLAVPHTAFAFMCTRATDATGNPNGPSLSWPTRALTFTLNAAGTKSIDPNTTFSVLQQAFSVWQNLTLNPNDVATCGNLPGTDLTFAQGPSTNANWVGYNFLDPKNNTNLLVFRDTAWNNDPNAVDIIALTTTTYSALTGEIIDADIEFNSFQFHFVATTPGTMDMDLLNTAVHEIGHFIGLAHCVPSGTCGHQEVMEPTSNFGETQKRMLKCDDRAGIVFKYPAGAKNQYCAPTAACGNCSTPTMVTQIPVVTQLAGGTGRPSCAAAPAWLLPGLALGAWLWRKRRLGAMLLVLSAGSVTSACNDTQCDGNVTPNNPNAPLITAMQFIESVPQDPWRVVMATDFVDVNGDLGGGTANFYTSTNTKPTSSVPLRQAFMASGGVDPNSTSGRIELLVRFAQDTVSGAVLRLGTQLVDAHGNTSNCYFLNLSFALEAGTVP